jgi:hypothetical protein
MHIAVDMVALLLLLMVVAVLLAVGDCDDDDALDLDGFALDDFAVLLGVAASAADANLILCLIIDD